MVLQTFLLAGTLWALVGSGVFLLRQRSAMHLITLALLATGLIGTFHPILTLFVEPLTWRDTWRVDESVGLAVQADYAVFGLGLLVATYFAATVRPRRDQRSDRTGALLADVELRDTIVAWGLVLAGGILYAVYLERVGLEVLLNREDYAEKYLRSIGLGPLAVGLTLVALGCLWGEAGRISKAHKWLFRAISLAVALWSVGFLSVRSNLVVLLLGHLYLHCRRRGLTLARLRPGLLIVMAMGWVGLEGFAIFRGAFRGDVREAYETVVSNPETTVACIVGGSELSHPYITALEVYSDREAGELAGRSLLDAFRILVPLAIQADRPQALSESFVRSNYRDIAEIGGGTAFSLVAEAWLDFGPLIGPFLFGLMLGWLLARVEIASEQHPYGLSSRYAPFLGFMVATVHRTEVAMILKSVFSSLVPVLLFCVLAGLLRMALARGRRRERLPSIAQGAGGRA